MRQVHIKDVVGTERRLTRRLCSAVQPCGLDVNWTLRTKRANLSGERLTQDLYLRRADASPACKCFLLLTAEFYPAMESRTIEVDPQHQ